MTICCEEKLESRLAVILQEVKYCRHYHISIKLLHLYMYISYFK